MAVLNYKWCKVFETKKEALEVARYFHEVLRENLDYIENRILLSLEEEHELILVEFEDSNTHIHVDDDGDFPVLEIFVVG